MSIVRYSIPQIEDLEPDSYGDWVPYDEYEDLEVELDRYKGQVNDKINAFKEAATLLVNEFTQKLCALKAQFEEETNES